MPTLAQRIETLEAAVAELRDPIAIAASKDDHTLAKRLLELESQYAELKRGIGEVDNHAHGLGLDVDRLDNEGDDHEHRIQQLENARANPTIEVPHA